MIQHLAQVAGSVCLGSLPGGASGRCFSFFVEPHGHDGYLQSRPWISFRGLTHWIRKTCSEEWPCRGWIPVLGRKPTQCWN